MIKVELNTQKQKKGGGGHINNLLKGRKFLGKFKENFATNPNFPSDSRKDEDSEEKGKNELLES